jgi:D-psicose/D-tagatose/L-ribulose 3-epimerase
MKIGVTSYLLKACDDEIASSVPKLADLGFDFVEIVSRNPNKINTDAFRDILKSNIPAYAILAWCDYTIQNPAHKSTYIRDSYQKYLENLVDLANNIGAGVVVTSAGTIQGLSHDEAYECCAECLANLAKYSATKNVKIAVEAVNRYVTNFINTAKQALRLIKMVDSPNIGVALDTFHMNIEEKSYEDSFDKVGKHLFHIHLADNNRLAPSLGHINFQEILDNLRNNNYQGDLSLEIQVLEHPLEEAKLGLNYVRDLLA